MVFEKRDLFFGIFILVLIGFIAFVFATTTVVSPVTGGNYSGTMLLNCTTTINASTVSYNVTFYYNASGGATGTVNNLTETIWNDTADDGVFNYTSADISWLSDVLRLYNITCYADNGTDQEFASATANITIDNTAPNVTFSGITNTVNNGNYSGTMVINVSVSDATIGIDSVYFNITNSTGDQHNFTLASTPGGGYYNISVDTTGFTDGLFNVTVWANDTQLNNLNNTEKIQITIDNTAPTVAFTCTPTSVLVGDTVTCSCSGSDATAGVNSTTYTASPSTANTGTYTQNCIVVDTAGNQATASASYTIELSGSGVSSSGGSGTTSTFTYSKTIPQTAQEFSEIKKIETSSFSGGGLKVKERVKIKINAEEHFVGVRSITETSAVIEIASDPVQVELDIGEDAKVDIDDDGYYDIYVKLNGIASGKADVTIEYLNEVIPEEGGAVETTGEDITPVEKEEASEISSTKSMAWLYWIIGIIIVLIIVWIVIKKMG